MSKKKLISLFLAMALLFSAIIPVGSVFAAEAIKYHPDDWFGYHHSKTEIDGWIRDAVKYPTTSEDAIKALTGEIRPGDKISFQVEVEMPTGHDEVIQFMKDFNFNMVFPCGVNAMIEVYASDAPLLTDEEYKEKISEFEAYIDELEEGLQDEELLEEIETDVELKSLYNTYKDLVENRDKYYDIYLNQLETARTKYGFIDSSYGTADNWMGAYENHPDIDLEEGETFESVKNKTKENSWVAPKFTEEEYELAVLEFNGKYPSIVEEYMLMLEEAANEEDVSESDLEIIEIAKESLRDGTFYDTVIKYLEDCRDGYYQYETDYAYRFLITALAGVDAYNAYFGHYSFEFPDARVQRNQQCTYIFDINLIATDALSVGEYLTLPSLHWSYVEDCPAYWISLSPFQLNDYYPCNSRHSSFINFGYNYYVNNLYLYVDDENKVDSESYVCKDKRYLAINYIGSEYHDSNYDSKFLFEKGGELLKEYLLRAIRPLTVECRDEYGNLLKSETVETYDAYYDIVPEEIYDYQLVGPENIKGVINNEDTTVTFYYEHKDAEIKVRYVDFDGNELIPSKTIKGKTLDEYNAEPAEIYGYNLIIVPENASGILHEDSTDIQYTYKIKPASVSVNYLDTDGNKITKSDMIYGKMFDEYNAAPKEFDGYELVEIPENASGKMEEEVINVNYIYKIVNN